MTSQTPVSSGDLISLDVLVSSRLILKPTFLLFSFFSFFFFFFFWPDNQSQIHASINSRLEDKHVVILLNWYVPCDSHKVEIKYHFWPFFKLWLTITHDY